MIVEQYESEKDLLQKIHKIEISLLDEFVSICEKLDLSYYIMYGTLLGAVRHKGFIPWDDDVDVVMPRKDFEIFGAECQKYLNCEKFFFQSYETDRHYSDGNYHLRRLATTYAFKDTEHYQYVNNGIWIDIWALDNCDSGDSVPGNKRIERIRFITALADKRALVDCNGMNLKRKILYYLVKPLSLTKLLSIRKKYMTMNSNEDSEYLVNFSSPYAFEKELIRRDYYGDPVEMVFEGKKYRAPQKWDAILHQLYGDYMKLPPESERHLYHKPKVIELGEEQ